MLKKLNQIFEYITNPLIWFKNYLTMSDDEKKEDLFIRSDGYDYNDFLNDTGRSDPNFDPEEPESFYPSEEDLGENEELFKKWLFKTKPYSDDPTEIPAWGVMSYLRIVKNTWLVHETDYAREIINEGFSNGLEDYTKLAYSKFHSDFDRSPTSDPNYEYMFAFDADGYSWKTRRSHYGEEIIMFRSSGVEIIHYGDEEHQIIFMAGQARDFVWLAQYNNGTEWYIVTEFGESPYESDDVEDLIKWVIKNFDQYKKQIVTRRKN